VDEKEYDKDFMGVHEETLGHVWAAVVGDSGDFTVDLLPVAVRDGHYEEPCISPDGKKVLSIRYPEKGAVRMRIVCVLTGDAWNIYSCFPLLEGIGNRLTVLRCHTWGNGVEGVVAAERGESGPFFTFFATDYVRNAKMYAASGKLDVSLSALALRLKKASNTEMTIREGKFYDFTLKKYLAENPGKTAKDFQAPVLRLQGMRTLFNGPCVCAWQYRFPVLGVEAFEFMNIRIYRMLADFTGSGDSGDDKISSYLYASSSVLGSYVPKPGDDIEGSLWLIGHHV